MHKAIHNYEFNVHDVYTVCTNFYKLFIANNNCVESKKPQVSNMGNLYMTIIQRIKLLDEIF